MFEGDVIKWMASNTLGIIYLELTQNFPKTNILIY